MISAALKDSASKTQPSTHMPAFFLKVTTARHSGAHTPQTTNLSKPPTVQSLLCTGVLSPPSLPSPYSFSHLLPTFQSGLVFESKNLLLLNLISADKYFRAGSLSRFFLFTIFSLLKPSLSFSMSSCAVSLLILLFLLDTSSLLTHSPSFPHTRLTLIHSAFVVERVHLHSRQLRPCFGK